jgi:adenylate kinase family enzyme
LRQNYRGWQSLAEVMTVLEKRSTQVLLPTELILALLKREISSRPKRTLFVDGFPRELDQISYSLFFRDLAGYREDRDVFILVDVPEKVIDERMKGRRVCPLCQTSRNIKLLPTSKVGYEETSREFYLLCDNPVCPGAKMVSKEGDEMGIGPLKPRLEKDAQLMSQAFSLYGIPKILLRNSLPETSAKDFADDYEITPTYDYEWDEQNKKVKVLEKPWIFADDQGIPSVSLLASPVVVSFIKQLVQTLNS